MLVLSIPCLVFQKQIGKKVKMLLRVDWILEGLKKNFSPAEIRDCRAKSVILSPRYLCMTLI